MVELSQRLKKTPKYTTAVAHCGGKLKDYEFYEKLKVYDEMGQPLEIDLSKPGTPACMLRYDEDEDGDKLQQADILSIYLPPKDKRGIRRPHIEHGYLWGWEDLVEQDDCKTFVEWRTRSWSTQPEFTTHRLSTWSAVLDSLDQPSS